MKFRFAILFSVLVILCLMTSDARQASAQLVGQTWTMWGAAGFGNRTTATRVGALNLRHVIDCVDFSVTTNSAGNPVNIDAYAAALWVRDGDTDTAPPLYVWGLAFPATTQNGFAEVPNTGRCGLNIHGSVGQPISVRFSVPLEQSSEIISVSGHDE